MGFSVVDPARGEVVRTVRAHREDEVEARLQAAVQAQQVWARRSLAERAEVLFRLSDAFQDQSEELAVRMATEMGKPVAQGVAEAKKCAWAWRHYAQHAPAWLADDPHESDGTHAFVRNAPLGLILAIMPWNFPYWQAVRFAAPALIAGNGLLLKHAPSTPGAAEDLEMLIREAGAPDGLVPALFLHDDATGNLIDDPRVAAVTLTGSTRAGSIVAARAGAAIKPSVLELGGSDPFVVLADADVERAARVGAQARLLNAGQSCIAAKRFVVVASAADAFIDALRDHLASARVGDPRDPETAVGPMARRDLRSQLHDQVLRSQAAGARCVLGGALPDGPGAFYPPTLLLDCAPGMPAWDEELFGPVAAVQVVADEDAALAAANQTVYGLGSSVWTASRASAARFIDGIHAGSVFINGMVKSDPRLPFGGVGRSGYGRELGRDGQLAFVNRKTVWMDLP